MVDAFVAKHRKKINIAFLLIALVAIGGIIRVCGNMDMVELQKLTELPCNCECR